MPFRFSVAAPFALSLAALIALSACGSSAGTGVVLSIRFADGVPENLIDSSKTLTIAVDGAETSSDRVPLGAELHGHAAATVRYRPSVRAGTLHFDVAALDDSGQPIGRGIADGSVSADHEVTISVVLDVATMQMDFSHAVVDMATAPPDLAMADLAGMDLAVNDLAVAADLAGMDLSTSDIATSDMATSDIAMADLAMADLAVKPDAAIPLDLTATVDQAMTMDLAMADLTVGADLAVAADLTPPPDLTPPLDLTVAPDLFGKCSLNNNDADCPKGKFCSMTGFCAPKIAGGGNCTGEGDHGCLSANCLNNVCYQCGKSMLFVAAGAATLGSDKQADPMAFTDELPQHVATIGAFCVDRTEVTVAAYKACVKAGSCALPARTAADNMYCTYNGNAGDGIALTCITWQQAKTFCEWTGDNTYHVLGAERLPTEAEWEKQARGVDKRIWPWGNTSPTCAYENFDVSLGLGNACHDSVVAPGTDSPKGDSPYGTQDAAGNVYEWVSDWYDKSAYDACKNGCTDPTGPLANGLTDKVFRGGGWASKPDYTRCAFRYSTPPTDNFNTLGVRCVSQVF